MVIIKRRTHDIDMSFHLFGVLYGSNSWWIISIEIFMNLEWYRCEVFLWVNLNDVFDNVVMLASLWLMCVHIIIRQNLCGVLITHKITNILMRKVFSNQRLKTFVGIFESPVVKVFPYVFWVNNIDFASPDNHLSTLYSVFPLKHGMMGASVPMRQFMRRRTRQTLHW